jgi:hypothetical protein
VQYWLGEGVSLDNQQALSQVALYRGREPRAWPTYNSSQTAGRQEGYRKIVARLVAFLSCGGPDSSL